MKDSKISTPKPFVFTFNTRSPEQKETFAILGFKGNGINRLKAAKSFGNILTGQNDQNTERIIFSLLPALYAAFE